MRTIANFADRVATLRGFDTDDLGNRVRVIWQGAEYRGRGRKTSWSGSARFENCRVERIAALNQWNHERPSERQDDHRVSWHTITTGNFGGFDVWLLL